MGKYMSPLPRRSFGGFGFLGLCWVFQCLGVQLAFNSQGRRGLDVLQCVGQPHTMRNCPIFCETFEYITWDKPLYFVWFSYALNFLGMQLLCKWRKDFIQSFYVFRVPRSWQGIHNMSLKAVSLVEFELFKWIILHLYLLNPCWKSLFLLSVQLLIYLFIPYFKMTNM